MRLPKEREDVVRELNYYFKQIGGEGRERVAASYERDCVTLIWGWLTALADVEVGCPECGKERK